MTNDVVLREVTPDDLLIFFDNQLDATANQMVAFTSRDPTDKKAFMKHWAAILDDDTVTNRTILADGVVAGNIVCFDFLGKPHIGYWLGKEYWGRGLATRSLSTFLDELSERPLYASVAYDNLASLRVLQKCGFKITGSEKAFANARGEEIEEILLELK